jgi:hypothetical protein
MPIALNSEPLATRHVVVCQTGQRLDDIDPIFVGKTRYMVIFIVGNFTLEEANAFAQDTFDSVTVSNRDFYFQDSPGIHTVALSTASVPIDVQYVVGNFSTVGFVDAYTFYLTRHMIQYYTRSGGENYNRQRQQHRERVRLGLTGTAQCQDPSE